MGWLARTSKCTLASAHQVDNLELVAFLNPDNIPLVTRRDLAIALYGHARRNKLHMLQQARQGQLLWNISRFAINCDFHAWFW